MLTYKAIFDDKTLLSNYKSRDIVVLTCDNCQEQTYTRKNQLLINRSKNIKSHFCSRKCASDFLNSDKRVSTNCVACNTSITKKLSEFKKSKLSFCSKTCRTKYYNKNKSHGSKRSKLEIYLETKLVEIYPDICFTFNNREVCSPLELDIYIPSLKLAFELNRNFSL